MPQDNVQITITTADTVYTDFKSLPDSIKDQLNNVAYIDSIISSQEPAIAYNNTEDTDIVALWGLILIIALILYKLRGTSTQLEEEREASAKLEQERPIPQGFIYRGQSLKFSRETLHEVCVKYNSYYKQLNEENQTLFIDRLKEFIRLKDFYIMSADGFKEMPILVSAAAIQISLGLREYTFPYFSRIIIHQEEYIAYDPLRILIGNVQGKSIAISWKHFLEDYLNPTDGKNVGLHEMAHALQVQHLFQNYGFHNEFRKDYEHYDKIDDQVLQAERSSSSPLFDENALSNANEFWATSVELFFEKPAQLQLQYPGLYKSISNVLNQHTA